jgi:L-ectoine synthase
VIVRNRVDSKVVEWGNGLSYRLLLESDGMGFALAETVVRRGTESQLQYRNHLEACYCVKGTGRIVAHDAAEEHELRPGVLYALNQHDAHHLIADDTGDLVLISVFNPPLSGDEAHSIEHGVFSSY